jgi:YfiH family protein
MIRPPGFAGAAFGTAADGNGRDDADARARICAELGITKAWAWLRQVHGTAVVPARGAGDLGQGDAAFTGVPGLPLAVATADCLPVVLEGSGAVGIAHAGWRGAAAGVAAALRSAMDAAGAPAVRAAIGPGIGPCCFEVGDEVASLFAVSLVTTTSWGSTSVDLAGAVYDQLPGLEVWVAGECTMCDPSYRSYRRDRTEHRQVGVVWLPSA